MIRSMRWLLRLVLFRVLGSRVVLALAVIAWFRSAMGKGRGARTSARRPMGSRSAARSGADQPKDAASAGVAWRKR